MSTIAGTVPNNIHIQQWVKQMAAMCQPDNVYWCDGSEAEREKLTQVAVQCGDLLPLNQKELPGCYLHRSAQNDVRLHIWRCETLGDGRVRGGACLMIERGGK